MDTCGQIFESESAMLWVELEILVWCQIENNFFLFKVIRFYFLNFCLGFTSVVKKGRGTILKCTTKAQITSLL